LLVGRRRARRAWERTVCSAFAIEWMARQKELSTKSIQQLSGSSPRRQTLAEQKAIIAALRAQYGDRRDGRAVRG
jgi:hypothetical protein